MKMLRRRAWPIVQNFHNTLGGFGNLAIAIGLLRAAPLALTVGNFDGVHRGHAVLVASARAMADGGGAKDDGGGAAPAKFARMLAQHVGGGADVAAGQVEDVGHAQVGLGLLHLHLLAFEAADLGAVEPAVVELDAVLVQERAHRLCPALYLALGVALRTD